MIRSTCFSEDFLALHALASAPSPASYLSNIRLFIYYILLMKQSIHRYKASLFKSLAHPLRLAILDALREGEKTVTQLQELTGGEQATISQHLAVLRVHHFITFRKEGTLAYYRNEDAEVYIFLDLGRQLYERQLNRHRQEIDAQVMGR